MATYAITAPNGQEYHIDGPEGATQEQVQAEVMRQFPEIAGAPDEGLTGSVTDTGDYGQQPPPEAAAAPEAAPPAPQDDSALYGFYKGLMKPVDNLSRLALQIPGAEALDQTVSDALGIQRTRDSVDENDALRANNSRTGFQTLGTAVGTLPTLYLPGGGLTQGAAAGALSTDARDAGGIVKDAAVGGALGRAGDAAAGLIAPQVSSTVRRLLDEGVRLTPGQILGQNGGLGRIAKVAEDVVSTVPIAGGAVRAAQERGVQDLNTAAINRALRPIGQRLPPQLKSGTDAVAFAGDRLRDAYADVLPKLSGQLDRTFENRVLAIKSRANLPPEYAAKLDGALNELRNGFQRAGPNGVYNGKTLREASERLGDLASGWRRSDDPYLRIVGDTADQYRQQLHSLARRQNPTEARRLRDVDKGYASLVRVEKAAAGTADGSFTPAQYQSATRMTDRSARRRASARGQALDQDLASAANTVMTNRAAQGGSKDINSSLALIGGAGAALSGNPMAMGAAGLIAGGSAAYTRPAQAAAQFVLGRNPSAAEQTLSQIVRYGNRALAPSAAASISSLPN